MYTDFFNDAIALLDVIKIGSISGVSELTGEHRTTISRKIQRLEFHLKNLLINTKSGRVELTSYGEEVIPRLQTLVQQMNTNINALTQKGQSKNLQIRFFNNVGIYYFFGMQCIESILQEYHDVSIEMTSYTYYQMMNFGSMSKSLFDQFDIIFIHDSLIHLIHDEEWIMKLRLDTEHKLYASETYLSRHAAITSADQLKDHICIYNNLLPSKTWILEDASQNKHMVHLEQTIGCDAVVLQHQLIKNHYGVGLIPKSVVNAHQEHLINVLPELSNQAFSTYLLVNRISYDNPVIKNVVDSVVSTLKALNYWEN